MNTAAAKRSILNEVARPALEDLRAPSILSIGFRPFFLMATLTAVLWVPLWLSILSGAKTNSHFIPTALHAHEMLFGFACAVIAGFLLTAAANWTGRPTTSGSSLAALVVLWCAGRIALLSDWSVWIVAIVDISFLPLLAVVLSVPLIRAGSTKNLPFLGMLGALTLSNGLMHAATLEEFVALTGLDPRLGQTLALRVITLMMMVMGGRVIPLFTRNATNERRIGSKPALDRLAIGAFLLAALSDLTLAASLTSASLLLLAGTLHLYRMKSWGTFKAKAPLLWVLHAGYGSIALSLILEGLAAWELLPQTAALHLLTIGGIGGLCLGMMTRVSLGHSGRMLVAPKKTTLAFVLLFGACLVRVLGPTLTPSAANISYHLSGSLWTASFLLLLAFGWPIWTQPRVDQTPRTGP